MAPAVAVYKTHLHEDKSQSVNSLENLCRVRAERSSFRCTFLVVDSDVRAVSIRFANRLFSLWSVGYSY